MAAGDRKLTVVIAGDVKGLHSALDSASAKLSDFGGHVTHTAKIAAAGFAAMVVGAAVFGKSAIDAASDLNESLGKSNVVFGAMAKDIEKWASTASGAFGQTKQQALEAAGTYGNLFRAFGVGVNDSARMSKSLVELAADLASFNNTSVDDALLALRSGLSGETEPLKRFGVALTEDRLKVEALRLGLVKTTKGALEPGIKAQAAYALIMKDTALAQGDFARTSDGLANRQRILTARLKDLRAEIGMKLLPVAVGFAGVLLDRVVPALDRVGRWAGDVIKWMLQPFGLVGDLNSKVAISFQYLLEHLGVSRGAAERWRDGIKNALDTIASVSKSVWGWLRDNVPPVLAAIGDFIDTKVAPAIGRLVGWFRDDLTPAVKTAAAAFKEDVWPIIEDKVLPAIEKIGSFIVDKVLPALGELVVFIVEQLLPNLFNLWEWIDKKVIPVLQDFAEKAKEGFDKTYEAIKPVIGAVQWLIDKLTELKNLIPDIPDIPGIPGIGGVKDIFGGNVFEKAKGTENPFAKKDTGGIFRAPKPGGFGLAWLRDGERVSTPGRSTQPAPAMAGVTVQSLTVTSMSEAEARRHAHVFMDEIDRIQRGLR